jgi:hypothetical protein
MFELYSSSIDPNDADFQAYLRHYVSTKDQRVPDSIPYSELYKLIREGIREYIHETQGKERRPKK